MQVTTARGLSLVGFGMMCLIAAAAFLNAQGAQAGPQTRVEPWDAIQTAKAKVGGGTAFSASYVREGSKWIYDVILVKNGKLSEVAVDAATGKVLDSESVTPEEEGKELTADLHKVLGHKTAALAK